MPKNPKYQNVKSTVATGKTSKDVEVISKQNYSILTNISLGDQLVAKRKGEKFKRIKCSTLGKLLQEQTFEESIYKLGGDEENKEPSVVQAQDTESIYSHQTGVSQASAVTYATDMLGITSDTTFLLLDLRDPEEYAMWRIKEAINFPGPNISRDKIIPEIFRFRNKPDKLIIVYMQDERKGTQYAQLFYEKGYENIYLLSGGIENFLEEFPQLVEGRSVPTPKKVAIEAEEAKLAAKAAARKNKHAHCVEGYDALSHATHH